VSACTGSLLLQSSYLCIAARYSSGQYNFDLAINRIRKLFVVKYFEMFASGMILQFGIDVDESIGDIPDEIENEEVLHNEPPLWSN
jgi:cell division protein FtsI/penicillin-binding protein 2